MSWKKLFNRKIDLKYFVFEITPKCNHRCIFCYNVWRHHTYPQGEIDLNAWERIIFRLKKETKIQIASISGGEPLMEPRLFDLLDVLKKYGLKINLITNGSLIDVETAERLATYNISNFEIPLLAPDRDVHLSHKGVDDLDMVMEGIVNLKKAGGRVVTVFVATRHNIHLLPETLDLAVVLGSDGLMFNRINPASFSQIDLLPDNQQIKTSLDYLNDFAQKFKFPISCSIPVQPCVVDMDQYKYISRGYCPSGNFRSYYTVDFLGNVRICNHSPKILGNLLKEDFGSIIRHDYVQNFKKALPKDCGGCELIEKCRGGCKASSEVCYGDLFCSDPLARQRLQNRELEK